MRRKKGLESMQRLTTNHYRTKIALLRRIENILDEVLRIDRVNNLRLHGVRRDMGLLEHALRACEDGFCRLRHRLDPASLLGFDARLLLCFVLWVGRATEFEQFPGQRGQGMQEFLFKDTATT